LLQQKLLGNIQHQRTIIERSSSEIICQNLFLALSFVVLPNMIASMHDSSSLFVVFVLCATAFGFLVGCSTARIFLMLLLSTSVLSGAVSYSHFSKLPNDCIVFNRLLIKREMNLLPIHSSDDIFVKSSAVKESTASKSLRRSPHSKGGISIYLRPDHVVGTESIAEPKTQENIRKRKEVVERIK
uniref:Transmembrane protein n=1 Tax=Brugia pahangi TaxID=6280 RepID=A0A0N4TN99_BRUPA